MRVLLAIAALLLGAFVAAVSVGLLRWRHATDEALAAMTSAATAVEPCSGTNLNALPPPVSRFFQLALTSRRPCVSSITITQDAEMLMNGAWRPLDATQQYTVSPPGFVWDARLKMAPMLSVLVRDQYIAGRGALRASILGVYPVADLAASPELNAGELQRFLGEAIWFPTALLPSAVLKWSARDDHSATATLSDRDLAVSLIFEFDAGHITAIRGFRYREDHGNYSLQPWLIQCGDYAGREQMMIARRCEVSWIEGGTPVPYWRGRLTSVSYGYN